MAGSGRCSSRRAVTKVIHVLKKKRVLTQHEDGGRKRHVATRLRRVTTCLVQPPSSCCVRTLVIFLDVNDFGYCCALSCIATVTQYNARVTKPQCGYKLGAVTFYFAILERARDQNELPYSEGQKIVVTIYIYISPL